ncbi:MAG: HPr family phosphocarrier protein [Pseudomonadota bacterium]
MINQQVIIINKLGLHTRAAAKLVAIAQQFASKIQLTRNDQTIDAKSIMGVITLGATKGTKLDLIISGNDEAQALQALLDLIGKRFGEAE